MNDWRLISSAPHIPAAIGSGGHVGPADVDGCDGAVEVAEVDTEADEGGIPSPGEVWPWCEAIAVAMPALAPATTTTLAAASTGAQPRPRPGPRPRRSARLPVPAASPPGLVGQPERDVFHGHPARRLGRDPVQHLR